MNRSYFAGLPEALSNDACEPNEQRFRKIQFDDTEQDEEKVNRHRPIHARQADL